MKPQNKRLLKALRSRKRGLTTGEIRDNLAIGDPATRVFELKKQGHAIHREMVEVTNRFKETCRVARYTLLENAAGAQSRAA